MAPRGQDGGGGHATRLIGNSAWNAAAFVGGVGLNLAVLPFVVARLGAERFGVAGLVIACTAPATIFGVALAQMTARELALHLAPERREAARAIFATALLLALAIGAAIALLIAGAGPWLARRAFHLDGEAPGALAAGFAYAAAGWFAQCVAGVVLALYTARQDYARLAQLNLAAAVVGAALVLWLLPRHPDAPTYLGCLAAGYATSLGGALLFAGRGLRGWIGAPRLHPVPLRALLGTGAWQLTALGGGLVAAQADRYMLGAFLAPRQVGYYNVAQRLEEAIYIGVIKIGEVLFPLFGALQRESHARQADAFFRAAWVLNLLAVSVLGALIPVARDLLRLWTGDEVARQGQQVLALLALAGILGSGTNVFSFYLLASGKTHLTALISLVTTAATLATSVILLPLFGWGAAGWSSVAGMAAQLAVMALLVRRSFEVDRPWTRALHCVLMPLAVGVGGALLLRWLAAQRLVDGAPHAWWQVIGGYGASVALIAVATVAAALLGPYRRTCAGDLGRIARRLLPGTGG